MSSTLNAEQISTLRSFGLSRKQDLPKTKTEDEKQKSEFEIVRRWAFMVQRYIPTPLTSVKRSCFPNIICPLCCSDCKNIPVGHFARHNCIRPKACIKLKRINLDSPLDLINLQQTTSRDISSRQQQQIQFCEETLCRGASPELFHKVLLEGGPNVYRQLCTRLPTPSIPRLNNKHVSTAMQPLFKTKRLETLTQKQKVASKTKQTYNRNLSKQLCSEFNYEATSITKSPLSAMSERNEDKIYAESSSTIENKCEQSPTTGLRVETSIENKTVKNTKVEASKVLSPKASPNTKSRSKKGEKIDQRKRKEIANDSPKALVILSRQQSSTDKVNGKRQCTNERIALDIVQPSALEDYLQSMTCVQFPNDQTNTQSIDYLSKLPDIGSVLLTPTRCDVNLNIKEGSGSSGYDSAERSLLGDNELLNDITSTEDVCDVVVTTDSFFDVPPETCQPRGRSELNTDISNRTPIASPNASTRFSGRVTAIELEEILSRKLPQNGDYLSKSNGKRSSSSGSVGRRRKCILEDRDAHSDAETVTGADSSVRRGRSASAVKRRRSASSSATNNGRRFTGEELVISTSPHGLQPESEHSYSRSPTDTETSSPEPKRQRKCNDNPVALTHVIPQIVS